MTIPNLLTLIRLMATPGVVALIYWTSEPAAWGAFILFILAMVTDGLDGVLARRLNQVTPLGTFLDPVVDKVILLSLFIVLADLRIIPVWMALLMLARELVVDGVRQAGALQRQLVGANFMGKTKAWMQSLCVGIALAMRCLKFSPDIVQFWVTLVTGLTLLVAWTFAFVFLYWNRSILLARVTTL